MAKPLSIVVPSIERRISTWHSIMDKAAEQKPSGIRPTITISREFGCEGYPLAEHLKDILEQKSNETWNIYDKALLEKVSSDEKLSITLLKNLGSSSSSLDILVSLIPNSVTHHEAYLKVAKAIIHVAELGNAIIVGRGGAILTQKLSNCFHFRLEASLEFRISSYARRSGISLKKAENIVKSEQKTREMFIKDCLSCSVSDQKYYEAIYNNERHTIHDIAWSILGYVSHAWPDKEYFKL